jgi:hypothetical protein
VFDVDLVGLVKIWAGLGDRRDVESEGLWVERLEGFVEELGLGLDLFVIIREVEGLEEVGGKFVENGLLLCCELVF